MYTMFVTVINTNIGTSNPPRVTVDWSQEKETNIHHLVEWLKGYPRKGHFDSAQCRDIHVYIPRRFNRSPTAPLRATLQIMGCVVTAK